MKIANVTVMPVAVADSPLRGSTGINESYTTRVIVELETDNGYVDLGECPGGQISAVEVSARKALGEDPRNLHRLLISDTGSLRAYRGGRL